MRKTTILLALGLLGLTAVVGLWGCAPDNPAAPEVPLVQGDARLARPVVSIGNSLTAGMIGSGLAVTGQLASFPNVLSALVSESLTGAPGGVSLDPPNPVYMQLPVIYAGETPTSQQQKGIGSTTTGDGQPLTGLFVDGVSLQITADLLPLADVQGWLKNATYPLAYDNLGVPGAYTEDANSATSSANSKKPANSFFDFILRNSQLPPFNTTQMTQLSSHFTKETIVGQDATGAPVYAISIPRVITVWLGGNDVLLGATGGNPVVGENVVSADEYESYLVPILDQVAEMAAVGESQVVLGNMQTRLPFFDTLPMGTDVGGTFVAWNTEESNVVRVTLNAGSLDPPLGAAYLPSEYGGTETLPSTVTITQDEWDALQKELDAYNQIIRTRHSSRGWAMADINTEFGALPLDPNQPLNGFFPWADFTGDGIPEQNAGSAYGLDGIHNSEKGYAQIANIFAAALNATYGTSYGSKDVASVTNVAGFEQILFPPSKAATSFEGPLFTPRGAAALSGLPELVRRID